MMADDAILSSCPFSSVSWKRLYCLLLLSAVICVSSITFKMNLFGNSLAYPYILCAEQILKASDAHSY